jgi:hypothetical protein
MQVRLPVFSAAMTMLPLPRRSGSGSSGSITFGQLISLQVQQLIKVTHLAIGADNVTIEGLCPTARRAELVALRTELGLSERLLPICGDVLEFLTRCLKDGLQSAY